MPDNGPNWAKLRSDDLADVDFGRSSDALVQLVHAMLRADPDARVSAAELVAHPVVARLTALDADDAVRGAVVEEPASFLAELFASAGVPLAAMRALECGVNNPWDDSAVAMADDSMDVVRPSAAVLV